MATDDEILQELREQTKWLRLLGFQALKPVLQQALSSDKHKAVYEYSDGRNSVRDVAALAGVSAGWVSKLWPEWIALGICTESPTKQGRAQHLTPLSRLGIDVPTAPATNGATVAPGKTKGRGNTKAPAHEAEAQP